MAIAREIAENPRVALRILKQHFASTMQHHLAEYVREELRMHEITIRRPKVCERIQALLGHV